MAKSLKRLLILPLLVASSAWALGEEPTHTEPNNSLEHHLLAVQAGERSLPSFFDHLVDSEVVVLSKKDVLDQQTPEDITPLVLPAESGDPRMLAVFTSPELALRVANTYPEYRFGITTGFVWVLAHTSPGLGLAINPGWSLGMKIPSFGVLQMREHYARRIDENVKKQ